MKTKYILKVGILLSILLLVYPASTTSATPVLEIESITGGFGVTAMIRNTGDEDAINVAWNITFKGGMIFVPNGRNVRGNIPSLAPDETAFLTTPVFGFAGPVGILSLIEVSIYVHGDEPCINPPLTTPPLPRLSMMFLFYIFPK